MVKESNKRDRKKETEAAVRNELRLLLFRSLGGCARLGCRE